MRGSGVRDAVPGTARVEGRVAVLPAIGMPDGILAHHLGNCLKTRTIAAVGVRHGCGENGKAKGQAGKAKTGDHVHFLVLLVASCDKEVLFVMTAVCDPRHTLDHSTSLGHPRAALGAITGRLGSASNC